MCIGPQGPRGEPGATGQPGGGVSGKYYREVLAVEPSVLTNCYKHIQGGPKNGTIFTVRRYALHGICNSNSVCLSVRPSVRLSDILVDCVHMVRPTIMISAPYGSHIILVSGDIKFIPKFEGGHP